MVFGVKLTQNVFRFEQVFQDFLDKIGNGTFFLPLRLRIYRGKEDRRPEGLVAVAGANKRSRSKCIMALNDKASA